MLSSRQIALRRNNYSSSRMLTWSSQDLTTSSQINLSLFSWITRFYPRLAISCKKILTFFNVPPYVRLRSVPWNSPLRTIVTPLRRPRRPSDPYVRLSKQIDPRREIKLEACNNWHKKYKTVCKKCHERDSFWQKLSATYCLKSISFLSLVNQYIQSKNDMTSHISIDGPMPVPRGYDERMKLNRRSHCGWKMISPVSHEGAICRLWLHFPGLQLFSEVCSSTYHQIQIF